MRLYMFGLSLLLFLLLAETSQGIRFEEESFAFFRKMTHKGSSNDGVVPDEVMCKGEELCPGNVRKLMTNAVPPTISKSERSDGKGEATHNFTKEIDRSKKTDKIKRPADFHVEPPQTYPDILDIAGMDYSPARRKAPIHN